MPKDKEPTSLAEIERLYKKYLELPDKWSENELKMAISAIVDRKTATKISSRIYQDVEQNMVFVNLEVQHSEHSVEMQILLEALRKGIEDVPSNIGSDIVTGAIMITLNSLVKDIKKLVVAYWKRRMKVAKSKGFSFYG